jgi:hypothetical protein
MYTATEGLPDDALQPWQWFTDVICPLGSNRSEQHLLSGPGVRSGVHPNRHRYADWHPDGLRHADVHTDLDPTPAGDLPDLVVSRKSSFGEVAATLNNLACASSSATTVWLRSQALRYPGQRRRARAADLHWRARPRPGEPVVPRYAVTDTPPHRGCDLLVAGTDETNNVRSEPLPIPTLPPTCTPSSKPATSTPTRTLRPTSTATVTVTSTPTFLKDLADLEKAIKAYGKSDDIASQLERSLLAKVDAARSSIQRGRFNAAANQLNALVHEIEAQRGKKISDRAANDLVGRARLLVDRLMAGDPATPTPTPTAAAP